MSKLKSELVMQGVKRQAFNLVGASLGGLIILGCSIASSFASSSASFERPSETLCREALSWHIDTVDPAFSISRTTLREAANEAVRMWNQAAGFELFTANEGRGIKVRLTYDHRQQLEEYTKGTRKNIARISEQITRMDTQLENERQRLESTQQALNAVNQRMNDQAARIDAEIAQHANRRGQVPRTVAQRVNAWQSELQQLVDEHNADIIDFNQRQAELNTKISMRNALATQHTQLANEQNMQVQRTQAEWARRDMPTNAGLHSINTRTRHNQVTVLDEVISVYSVRNKATLVAVLAHEFGHAIGLSHVQGAHSIMSERLEGELAGSVPQQLSSYDRQALSSVCGISNSTL